MSPASSTPAPAVPRISRLTVVIGIVVAVATAALIIVANRGILFETEIHETGDFAVNALQIDYAKRFAEIYGNYSRFHFHHPGPAFFYVYAIGERLLFDGLAAVPSPFNAHVVFGIGLQAAFFALALILLAELLQGLRTICVGLLVAAIHFGQVEHAFTGTWPPEVLLMPFLAFFAATAVVSTGRLQHLPWMVLAGSFLVHGHVAQPLFVGTLAVIAYVGAWRRHGRLPVAELVTTYRAAHAISLVLLVVFLIPMLLDVAQGAPNFRTILLHIGGDDGQGKSVFQSALYYLAFTTYTAAPELLLGTLSRETLGLIGARPVVFAIWILSVAVFAIGARRHSVAPGAAPTGLRVLWRFWLITSALCVVWGILQAGPMFAFNGHFYFAVHYLAYLGAASVVISWLPARAIRWIAAPISLAALIVIYDHMRIPENRIDRGGVQLRRTVDRILEMDPRPDQPKLLVFPHQEWGHGASVALALLRRKVEFVIEREMRFMFESRAVAPIAKLANPDLPYSVWRFVPEAQSDSGPLAGSGPGITFAAGELAPDGGEIPFGDEAGFSAFHVAGISGGQNGRSWTKDPDVVLQFRPQAATADVILSLDARPFIRPERAPQQRVEFRFNGELIWSGAFTQPAVIEVRVPAALWNQRETAHVWLHFPDAIAPVVFGDSLDFRVLALEMSWLRTRLADSTGK